MHCFNKIAPHSTAEVQKIIKNARALIDQIDSLLDTAKKQKNHSQKADGQ